MPKKKSISKETALALIPSQDNSYAPIVFEFSEKDPMQLALSYQERFGFNIEHGDLMIYNTKKGLKPYITAQGCGKIAISQKIATNITIVETGRNPPYFALVRCDATRDMVTIQEFGYCDSTEPGKNGKPFNQILAMAITRARNRAVKFAAFGPSVYEEFTEDEQREVMDITELTEGVRIEEALQKCPVCGAQGWSKSRKECLKCLVKYEELLKHE